jgi:hypothetical protein
LEQNVAALDGTLTDEEFSKLKTAYGDSASLD